MSAPKPARVVISLISDDEDEPPPQPKQLRPKQPLPKGPKKSSERAFDFDLTQDPDDDPDDASVDLVSNSGNEPRFPRPSRTPRPEPKTVAPRPSTPKSRIPTSGSFDKGNTKQKDGLGTPTPRMRPSNVPGSLHNSESPISADQVSMGNGSPSGSRAPSLLRSSQVKPSPRTVTRNGMSTGQSSQTQEQPIQRVVSSPLRPAPDREFSSESAAVVRPNSNRRQEQHASLQDSDIPISAPTQAGKESNNVGSTPKSDERILPLSTEPRLNNADQAHDSYTDDEQIEAILEAADASSGDRTPPRRSRSQRSSQSSVSQSLGTDSPLLKRISQRQLKNAQPSKRDRSQSPREAMARKSMAAIKANVKRGSGLSLKELEESLQSFRQAMRENHATTVRYLLENAEDASGGFESQFIDEEDPFENMDSVQLPLGEKTPVGATTVKFSSFILKGKSSNNNSKLTKSNATLIAKKIHSDTPRVPKYSGMTHVKRNILTADDEKLRFIPYLGEDNGSPETRKKLEKEMAQVYGKDNQVSARDTEKVSSLRDHLGCWLQDLDIGCTQKDLERFVLEDDDECKHFEIKPRDRTKLLNSYRDTLEHGVKEMAMRFSHAFWNVFGIALGAIILPPARIKELLESRRKPSGRRSLENPESALTDDMGTFATLVCLICSAIDCQTHGEHTWEHPPESDNDCSDDQDETENRENKLQTQRRIVIPMSEDLIRNYEERLFREGYELEEMVLDPKDACSSHCYAVNDTQQNDYDWDEKDLNDLAQMLIGFTEDELLPCDLSIPLDRPCWQVYREIKAYRMAHPRTAPDQTSTARARRPDWYDNRKKTLKNDWQNMTSAHLQHQRYQTNPCLHTGPCTSKCSCVESNILCEETCCCPDDCPRRFTGCSCVSFGLACVAETCICIQMNRECGSQCSSCGAVERLNPINKYDDDLFTHGCQNVSLQRGVAKRLVIGESQLSGYGLYAAEPARKHEFLIEYTGELISGLEAERRGIIYDRRLLSFLFDLNNELIIDAARLGNKSRFINHADDEGAGLNCQAKICLVNGEHRIKFIALRDIAIGEELLFNYGKKFAEKHGLDKKLPKVKEATKKGVVTGEEALDALDGMDRGKRMSRKTVTAIRGSRSAARGRGNKARKTALPRRATTDEPESAPEPAEKSTQGDRFGNLDMPDLDDSAGECEENRMQGGEDESEQEDMARARPKRRIKGPERYTR